MRHDGAAGGGAHIDRGQQVRDVFIRQAVKAVAAQAGLGQAPGQCKCLSQRRLPGMECGIEAGHLGQFGRARRDRPDSSEIVRLVQRRERHQARERIEHRGVHPHRRGKLNPPVDHAMAGGEQTLSTQPLLEPVEQEPCGALVPGLRRGAQFAFCERGALGVARAEARLGQNAFDLAAQREFRRARRAVEEHGKLQAR